MSLADEGVTRGEVLAFVRRYYSENGHGPSVRNVADAVGIGTSTAAHHIDKLRAQGLLVGGDRPHTLRPAPVPGHCAACGQPVNTATVPA